MSVRKETANKNTNNEIEIEQKLAEELIKTRTARINGSSGCTLDKAILIWESTINKMKAEKIGIR